MRSQTNTLNLENTTQKQSKAANYALWTVQILGAAMFFMAGGGKLAGAEMHVQTFEAIGIGQWFRYVTGGIEVVAAILLLVPRFAGLGGLLLVPTMIGAILTHMLIVGGSFAVPAVLLVLTAIVAYCRRQDTLNLIGR